MVYCFGVSNYMRPHTCTPRRSNEPRSSVGQRMLVREISWQAADAELREYIDRVAPVAIHLRCSGDEELPTQKRCRPGCLSMRLPAK